MIDMSLGSKDRYDIEWSASCLRKSYGENYFSKSHLTEVLKDTLSDVQLVKDNGRDIKAISSTLFDKNLRDILNYSIYTRYLTGGVKDLLNGLYTYGRLGYILNLVRASRNLLADSVDSMGLLISSAGYDSELLKASKENLPRISKKSGRYWTGFESGLYAIIGNDLSERDRAIIDLNKALRLKKLSKNAKAYLKCFSSIVIDNNDHFFESIKVLLEQHYDGCDLSSYVDLPVIGLYNLAYFDPARGDKSMPPEPNHKYWDSELWHEIIKPDQKREYIIDIAKVSPLLKKWMDELPEQIDLDELVKSLKKK